MFDLQNWIDNLNFHGTLLSTAYDTSYVALLDESISVDALNWLKENQNSDGSWGKGPFFFKLMETAAATYALLVRGYAFSSGIKWLNNHLHQIEELSSNTHSSYTGVGYSIYIPIILYNLYQLNTSLKSDLIEKLHIKRCKLFNDIDISQLLESHKHLLFSLEGFEIEYKGENLDLFLIDGSVAASVSASAWYAKNGNTQQRENIIRYLQKAQNEDGGWPQFYPLKEMTTLYTLYPLYKSLGFLPFPDPIDAIVASWKNGMSFSRLFQIPDLDDTVLSIILGFDKSLEILDKFERSYGYEGYQTRVAKKSLRMGDAGMMEFPGISCNLHTLDLLLKSGKNMNDYRIKLILKMFDRYFQSYKFLSTDKWHISPAYNNNRGVLVFSHVHKEYATKCYDFFVENMKENGLWGNFGCEIEDTSFAIHSILYYNKHVSPIELEPYEIAFSFLFNDIESTLLAVKDSSPQWIAKGLYRPLEMIQGGIIAAYLLFIEIRVNQH